MCETNQELLDKVLLNLSEISKLASAQADARKRGNLKFATELDIRLDELFGQKTRLVDAWQDHVRDHGCHKVERHA